MTYLAGIQTVMLCPYCQTENREDQELCYHCGKDLSLLRVMVNKARHHYNQGLEFAERGQDDDAINEMRNAISHYGLLVDAHVVLGTLYAKKKQFAKARECWSDAIATDYRLQKAHRYLEKVEQAPFVYPALGRLKNLSYAMLALAVMALGLTAIELLPNTLPDVWDHYFLIAMLAVSLLCTFLGILLARPDAAVNEVRHATRLILNKTPDLDRAEAVVAEIEKRGDGSSMTTEYARRIRQFIEYERNERDRVWQLRISSVTEALDRHAPYVALRLLEGLERETTDEGSKGQLAELRSRAVELMDRQIDAAAGECESGEITFASFEKVAKEYLEIAASEERAGEVRALIDRLRSADEKRRRTEASNAIRGAETAAQAVEAYRTAVARDPALEEHLKPLAERRIELVTTHLVPEIGLLLEQDKLDEATQHLDLVVELNEILRREVPEATLAEARSMIAARRSAATVETTEKARTDKAWDKVLELTEDLSPFETDPETHDRLAAMREEASESYATEICEWLSGLQPDFESGTVSDEVAARVLENYEWLIDHLPDALEHARPDVLFAAASASMKLGKAADARDLLAQIEQDNPDTAAAESATAFKSRFAQELGLAETPGEEQSPAETPESPGSTEEAKVTTDAPAESGVEPKPEQETGETASQEPAVAEESASADELPELDDSVLPVSLDDVSRRRPDHDSDSDSDKDKSS